MAMGLLTSLQHHIPLSGLIQSPSLHKLSSPSTTAIARATLGTSQTLEDSDSQSTPKRVVIKPTNATPFPPPKELISDPPTTTTTTTTTSTSANAIGKEVRTHVNYGDEGTVHNRAGRGSIHDYLEAAPEFLQLDGGPPRWFCPLDAGCPPANAPLLLFLPGMDGTGIGLICHHESLGRLFEVRCLHVPLMDRTSFQGLVEIVEDALRTESSIGKQRPIYLVGDSLGGALALAVASRNPERDLMLVLSNPATSFDRSQLQPILPLMQFIPEELYSTIPYLLSFTMGNPVLMASAKIEADVQPWEGLQQLADNLTALLPSLPIIADIVPQSVLLWKLKLLHSAALYTNSRLHAVNAEVLLLASGSDKMLPSKEEALRLKKTLKKCRVRYFKDNGHTLLLEDGLDLATIIKAAGFYKKSKVHDHVRHFILPTREEYDYFNNRARLLFQWASPAFFSTASNGEVVRGLSEVPTDGPVLFVGIHMLMGLETVMIIREFLRQKNCMVRGIAHPLLFESALESDLHEPDGVADMIRLFGAVPVSGKNLFKLLSNKEHVLLYPGGGREALHRKKEEYKLFWPNESEFVRMAARFNAKIVPFSVVGEDELLELLFDYNDTKKIPFIRQPYEELLESLPKFRSEMDGEVFNQPVHFPIVAPKLSGRMYILFGKPISTAERRNELYFKEESQALYLEVQREVEKGIAYLLAKREDDPYKDLLPRILYQTSWGGTLEAPSFKP